MKVNPVSLMPIFRSAVQGKLLALLIMNPEKEFSMTDLAGRIGTSLPTALREIRRLEQVGFVLVRALGNMQMVRTNMEHQLFKPLAEIVMYSFGPLEVLKELFVALPGVEEAWIYGSWAERYSSIDGADPGDIDLLVIGDVDRSKCFDLAQQASLMIGKEVAVNNFTRQDWDRSESSFAKTVRGKPMIAVVKSDS